LVDKNQFFDGLFAISHEFTPDINSNCINVKSGAVIFVQNAHGGFSPMNRLRGISAEWRISYSPLRIG